MATTTDETAALRRLLTWMSPAFPVGSFSYSHGIEWAVEAGDVRDGATLSAWIESLLRHGAGRSDAILLAEAWRAATSNALDAILRADELAGALAAGRERHLETTAQGAAFLKAVRTGWSAPLLDALAARVSEGPTYPVAVGAVAGAHALPLAPAVTAYLQAWVATLVSAGVRLIPLGQSEALVVIAGLDPLVAELASAALSLTLDDLGGFAFRSDIAALRHETQHTRLFRT
jgi:urease accessory protein